MNIYYHAKHGYYIPLKNTLDNGINPNIKNDVGNRPLHEASLYGHNKCIQLLLERGADINSKGWGGMTPLHLASKIGNYHTVQLLLEMGADPFIINDFGELAKDICSLSIKELIESYEFPVKSALDD